MKYCEEFGLFPEVSVNLYSTCVYTSADAHVHMHRLIFFMEIMVVHVSYMPGPTLSLLCVRLFNPPTNPLMQVALLLHFQVRKLRLRVAQRTVYTAVFLSSFNNLWRASSPATLSSHFV